jgi:hypothetical protein
MFPAGSVEINRERAAKLYRKGSAAAFFVPKPRWEGSKLNAERLEQARALLVQGQPLAVVAADRTLLPPHQQRRDLRAQW